VAMISFAALSSSDGRSERVRPVPLDDVGGGGGGGGRWWG